MCSSALTIVWAGGDPAETGLEEGSTVLDLINSLANDAHIAAEPSFANSCCTLRRHAGE